MAKRLNKPGKRKRTSYFPIKVPINSLSGGVGRQAPSKRMPNEAEDLDNVFCTTERSIDKRNGFSFLTGGSDLGIDNAGVRDVWWYWFLAGRDRQYLIGIDKRGTSSNMLHVYKKTEGGLSAQAVDTELPEEVVEYIKHGSLSAQEGMRACTVGSSVLILNTEVKAGFTSDGEDNFTFDLDGNKTETEDVEGRKITYLTAAGADPEGLAQYWIPGQDYIWGDTVIDATDPVHTPVPWAPLGEGNTEAPGEYYIWKVKPKLGSLELPGPTGNDSEVPPRESGNVTVVYGNDEDYNGTYWYRNNKADREWEDTNSGDGQWNSDNNTADVFQWKKSKYIPVEDYVYPDPTKLYLGQSISKFSDLKFPPDETDVIAHNGDAHTLAAIMALYPDSGDSQGRGKIYYLSQAYLASTPGWYRVISDSETPYLEKVRTPDKLSVLDKKRMPMQIYLDEEANKWSIRMLSWDPRTSGTEKNNKGPSFFRNSDGKAVQTQIKALSYYRDRLFLASEDTLVSSKLGDFSNFFLDDPANITFTDPVDLRVSSNVFTPITYLQPFRDFLFLATAGETQYELLGSENQISPLSAEIAPTSFFPMTEDIAPLVMNNNLFFFSKRRLFIYFSASESSGQQAFELSRHVPEYLPEKFKSSTVSAAHNTIFAVSGEESNKIFCYRNLVSGDQIMQNAFYTMTLGESSEILNVQATEDELLLVTKGSDPTGRQLFSVQSMSLIPDGPEVARLDNRSDLTPLSVSYDSANNQTEISVGVANQELNQLVSTGGQHEGEVIDVSVVGGEGSTTLLRASGDYSHLTSCSCGTKFTAKAELSTLYVRDQQNNIVSGPLNLRYAVFRHRNTGAYDVKVGRKNRSEKAFSFTHNQVGSSIDLGDSSFYEKDGVFKVPVLGFSDDLVITLESSSPNPMNITNIEFAGKFKQIASTLTM